MMSKRYKIMNEKTIYMIELSFNDSNDIIDPVPCNDMNRRI
jgi:hypothetical protein